MSCWLQCMSTAKKGTDTSASESQRLYTDPSLYRLQYHVVMSSHCEVAMSYHKDDKQLKCHTCGYTMPVPNYCPECGSDTWRYLGLGTQKLEELVQIKFRMPGLFAWMRIRQGKMPTRSCWLPWWAQGGYSYGNTDDCKRGWILKMWHWLVSSTGMPCWIAVIIAVQSWPTICWSRRWEEAGAVPRGGEVNIQAYDTTHYAIQCAAHHDYRAFFRTKWNAGILQAIHRIPIYHDFSHTSPEEVARAKSCWKRMRISNSGTGTADKSARMRCVCTSCWRENSRSCWGNVSEVYDAHLAAKEKYQTGYRCISGRAGLRRLLCRKEWYRWSSTASVSFRCSLWLSDHDTLYQTLPMTEYDIWTLYYYLYKWWPCLPWRCCSSCKENALSLSAMASHYMLQDTTLLGFRRTVVTAPACRKRWTNRCCAASDTAYSP